jgi:hypothetical protein
VGERDDTAGRYPPLHFCHAFSKAAFSLENASGRFAGRGIFDPSVFLTDRSRRAAMNSGPRQGNKVNPPPMCFVELVH